MEEARLKKLARAAFRPERYRWWYAVGFGLLANLPSWAAFSPEDARELYES
ncbi:hypothetical protein [Rubrobacter marinus]|uniref:hypothetical protein n=1 Tax=Rubrobacter marinus TaxID=2653852 RepID=UPI00140BFCC0|nr:hypothetical protein [Rubrobacter marinus]